MAKTAQKTSTQQRAATNGHVSKFHMRLKDFDDHDLIHLVAENADNDGWVSTYVMAQAMWPKVMNGSNQRDQIDAMRAVGARFGYMASKNVRVLSKRTREGTKAKRFVSGEGSHWRLTAEGEKARLADLKASQKRTFETLDDFQLFAATAVIGRRYTHANSVAATLARRAWQASTGLR